MSNDIKLTDAEIGKCYRFSYHVTSQTESYYKQRNKYAQTEKLINDHFIAKLAELYVYYFLTNCGYTTSYPGFDIGNTKQARIKKYHNDADLVVFKNDKKLNIHIKCVRHDSPVKNSWLIQAADKCVNKPSDEDYFALCVFYSPERIDIVRLIEANRIKWQKTKVNLPSKLACYLDDLEKCAKS
jgi:hypothetical protein